MGLPIVGVGVNLPNHENQTLRPLKSVSPSRYLSLKQCSLREVLSANRVVGLLPGFPSARVGSVIHQLLQEVGEGVLEVRQDVLTRRWEELVCDQEEDMQSSDLERRFVPLRVHVANFEVRRVQALQRAGEMGQIPGTSGGAAASTGSGSSEATSRLYGCELELVSADGLVRGRADAVFPGPEGPIIKDFKSGAIHERGASSELRGEYVVQLRLYAALYHDANGVWPATLEVVPMVGPPRDVPFSRDESQILLADAREELENVNAVLATGEPLDLLAVKLATPGRHCGYCQYRPLCGPYREASRQQERDWPNDVWGVLVERRDLENGRLLFSIDSGSDVRVRVRGLRADPLLHPSVADLKKGDEVAFFSLRATTALDVFTEGAYSVLYIERRD